MERKPAIQTTVELLDNELRRYHAVRVLLMNLNQESSCAELLKKISQNFGGIYGKAKALLEEYFAIYEQFEQGRLERDAYSRRFFEITTQGASLEFDYYCNVEVDMQRLEKAVKEGVKRGEIPESERAQILAQIAEISKGANERLRINA